MRLSSAEGELVLAPKQGGCVSAFRWKGHDILRPLGVPHDRAAPTDYAAFPLFPFSGRIENARFTFEGTAHALTPNFAPEPHAIHGNAWQSSWHAKDASENSVRLVFEHDGPDWPWAYRAEQVFTLTNNGLIAELVLTNLSEQNMPGGIGWHPYFPRGDAILTADVSAVWLSGADMIPAAPQPLTAETDLNQLRNVDQLRLDNAFSAGAQGSKIHWPEESLSVVMTASDTLRHLVVFTPQGEDFFCVEPVSHSPNAINNDQPQSVTGLQILKPGESLSGTISLLVDV